MNLFNRLDSPILRALVAFGLLGGAACAARGPGPNPANGAPPPAERITICGRIESAMRIDGADGASTRLALRDARSGSRFTVTMSPSVRPAFESALGAAPEAAYEDKSVCATGTLRNRAGESILELAKPEDVTINALVR